MQLNTNEDFVSQLTGIPQSPGTHCASPSVTFKKVCKNSLRQPGSKLLWFDVPSQVSCTGAGLFLLQVSFDRKGSFF